MTEGLETSGIGILTLLAGGAVLVVVLLAANWFLHIAPMSRSRREWIARANPIIGMLLGLAYLLFAAQQVFKVHPASVPFALALLIFGFGAASWFAIRDFIAGVFIKAGRVCKVGDQVQVGDIKGRVQRMGYRVLSIETTQGDEAIIPYNRLSKESLFRAPVIEGVFLHVFRVEAPPGASLTEVRRVVRESALLCHWSSVVREPELVAVGPGVFEVTVFALDADRAPDVEAAVRRVVGKLKPPARPPSSVSSTRPT